VLSRIDTAIDELQQSLALVDAMFKSGLDGVFSFNTDVKTVKLGSLGRIIRGSSPRPKGDPKYYGGNVPRLMVADVTRDGRIVFPCIDFLTEEGAKKSRPVPKGTLTIQVSGNPGVPAILGVDACIHDGFAALVDIGDKVDINYLYFYLFYFSEKNQKQAVGAIFKNLTTDQLRQIDISLPDIDLQKKCVVSAENLAEHTTQLKAEITAKIGMFNQLKASVLDGAFRGEL
jgi:restriction endonuclease S subunit